MHSSQTSDIFLFCVTVLSKNVIFLFVFCIKLFVHSLAIINGPYPFIEGAEINIIFL
jgi:hypothetical protein